MPEALTRHLQRAAALLLRSCSLETLSIWLGHGQWAYIYRIKNPVGTFDIGVNWATMVTKFSVLLDQTLSTCKPAIPRSRCSYYKCRPLVGVHNNVGWTLTLPKASHDHSAGGGSLMASSVLSSVPWILSSSVSSKNRADSSSSILHSSGKLSLYSYTAVCKHTLACAPRLNLDNY